MRGWGINNQKVSKNRLRFMLFIPGKAQSLGILVFYGSASILFLDNFIDRSALFLDIIQEVCPPPATGLGPAGWGRAGEAGAWARRLVCLRRNG
jgi:hypothetical protein